MATYSIFYGIPSGLVFGSIWLLLSLLECRRTDIVYFFSFFFKSFWNKPNILEGWETNYIMATSSVFLVAIFYNLFT